MLTSGIWHDKEINSCSAVLLKFSMHISDYYCDELCELDKDGFYAIEALHSRLDDDADGAVDVAESNEVCTCMCILFANVTWYACLTAQEEIACTCI